MHFIRIIFLFISLSVLNREVVAQEQAKIDSLLGLLTSNQNDTQTLRLYYDIAKILITTDIDSARQMAMEGLYMAKKIEQDFDIGQFYAVLGDVCVVENNLIQALDNYQKSIPYYERAARVNDLSQVYLVIGNIYMAQANYPMALEFYQKGLVIADSLNMVEVVPHFYNNLGELNVFLKHYDVAIESYKKALNIQEDQNNSLGAAYILLNLCNVYMEIGEAGMASTFLDKANKIYQESSNNSGLHLVYELKGDIEKKRNNCEMAVINYNRAFGYLQKVGGEYLGPKSLLYTELYNKMGFCYIDLGQYNLAEETLLKGYKMAIETGLLESLNKISHNLSRLYEKTNKPEKSLEFYKLFKLYADSISKEENVKKITQLRMQFEFDKMIKEREVEDLKYKQNQKRKELLYLSIIGGSLLSLILLGMLFNLQRLKRKNLQLEKEKLLGDLDYKNKELTTNVMYLLKKNEFILSISDKLKNTRYYFKPENRKLIDEIIHDVEQSTSQDVWKDFEVRFQEVHTDFYDKLAEKYPDLSPNELRLCAFLRLNMSTKEISAITYQSPKSITMARFRLRKKMDIGSYENLISYLSQL